MVLHAKNTMFTKQFLETLQLACEDFQSALDKEHDEWLYQDMFEYAFAEAMEASNVLPQRPMDR